MDDGWAERRAELVKATKSHRDPKVRHRAHALLALVESPSLAAAERRVGVSRASLRRWRTRCLGTEAGNGAAGLADRVRAGRPPKLPAAARTLLATAAGDRCWRPLLATALEADPMAEEYGYPAATWTIADLTDLLARRGWAVSSATVTRAVRALGYVHRRPRHDLRHWQNAEAVASARHALTRLPKKGLMTPAESACSISTSASCTPIPTWQRAGSGLAAGGQRRGRPRRVAAAGTDRRVSVCGALDSGSGRLETMTAPTAAADPFGAFLGQVADRWSDDQLVLVLDNASYHKTAAGRAWVADHAARISVVWLPTYSPQLNLIERVWRFVQSKLAGHRCWRDLDRLVDHATSLLAATRALFAAPTYPHVTVRQDVWRSAKSPSSGRRSGRAATR